MLLVPLVSSLLSLSAAAAPPERAPLGPLAQDDGVARALSVFQLWLETKQRKEAVPSFSVAVVHDQELVWAKSLGYADVERKIAATPRTPYRIASLTKTFTATAILQLRDEGKLQLDDPVSRHLPWFTQRDVTVRQLLAHAGGLTRDVPGDFWDTMQFPDNASLPSLFARSEAPFGAGERFKYSNLGYAVAGDLVATLTKRSWADVVTMRVLQPLGMTSTRAVVGTDAASRVAVAYGPLDAAGKRPIIQVGAPGLFAPALGMASSAEDLARWLSFQMHEARENDAAPVLARASVKEMQRAQVVRSDWKGGWGLGWGVVAVEKDTPRVVHGGGTDRGYRSLVTFDPHKRVGFVVLTNSDASPRDVAEQLWKIVAPAIVKAKQTPVDKAKLAQLAKYTGRYVNGFAPNAKPLLVVVDNDGKLSLVEGDDNDPWAERAVLRDLGNARFRFESGDAEGDTITFELDGKGNVVRLVGFGWSARKVPD